MPSQASLPTLAKTAVRSRSRAARSSGYPRFLSISLALHAVVLVAGLTGGAAYMRRGGAEAIAATITFASAPESSPPSSVVEASAEPERPLENPDQQSESETSPVSPEVEEPAREDVAGTFTFTSSASEANRSNSSTALERAIGDPRSSWRLPSHEASGLRVGPSNEPPVSECCGEAQPAATATLASEEYVYPEVVSMARAEFPLRSQRLGEHGSVLLEMTVGADGLVKDVRVAQTSGHARIDDCAVAAAWDWIFKPATRNGVPEASLARHRYTFRLTGSGG